MVVDTATRSLRTGVRQLTRATRWAAGRGVGALHTVRRRGAKDLSDADLANKVRSMVFRGRDVANVDKGKIDVNVVDAVVWLRGEAPTPAAVNRLEAKTRRIPEVREVHNLLHLPKTPAPSRTDTPRTQRKTRRKADAPPRPRTEQRRVNADKTTQRTGDGPREIAAQRRGRQPAKMGSKDTS